MKIREALLSEANELSELALQSKATWDYSEEFIIACKEDLTITEEYINNNFVYVFENDNTKIGFFSFYVMIKLSISCTFILVTKERLRENNVEVCNRKSK